LDSRSTAALGSAVGLGSPKCRDFIQSADDAKDFKV